MLSKKSLLFIISQLSRPLRLNFYYRRQEYKTSYQATVINKGKGAKKIFLVIPIPPKTKLQKVRKIKFNLRGKVKKEEVYQNRFFFAKLSLKPKEKKIVKETFLAETRPVFYKHLPPFLISKPVKNRFIFVDKKIKTLSFRLTKNSRSSSDKIKTIYSFVKNALSYGSPIEGLYRPDQAYRLPCVDCGGFVTFFISLLAATSISSLPVFGFFANDKKNSPHAWAEIKGRREEAIPFDPSAEKLFEEGRSFTSGGFGWVGSDRIVLSRGCDFKIKLDNKIIRVDILQYPLVIPKDKEIKVALLFKTKRI